jgi:hypothetical protein
MTKNTAVFMPVHAGLSYVTLSHNTTVPKWWQAIVTIQSYPKSD